MVVVAIIGVLAFLIALLVRSARRPQTAGGGPGEPATQPPRWYEFTLALLLRIGCRVAGMRGAVLRRTRRCARAGRRDLLRLGGVLLRHGQAERGCECD